MPVPLASHEIRTPLNGIVGMLQLMRLQACDAQHTHYLDAALKSSNRLTRLLADILDLSKIEAGKLELHQKPFAVATLETSITEFFGPTIKKKHLASEFSVSSQTLPVLIGDENRLLQILFNLVGNAIKFTTHGTIRVSIQPLGEPHDGLARLLFVVSDTVIGISDEQLQTIFSPFVQGESTYTKQFQGAGLGLAIVKKLVALMDGELAVDSTVGEGSTFYLTVPFALPTPVESAVEPETPRQHIPSDASCGCFSWKLTR